MRIMPRAGLSLFSQRVRTHHGRIAEVAAGDEDERDRHDDHRPAGAAPAKSGSRAVWT